MPQEVKKKGAPRMTKEVRSSIDETLVNITTAIKVPEVQTEDGIDLEKLEALFDKGKY